MEKSCCNNFILFLNLIHARHSRHLISFLEILNGKTNCWAINSKTKLIATFLNLGLLNKWYSYFLITEHIYKWMNEWMKNPYIFFSLIWTFHLSSKHKLHAHTACIYLKLWFHSYILLPKLLFYLWHLKSNTKIMWIKSHNRLHLFFKLTN